MWGRVGAASTDTLGRRPRLPRQEKALQSRPMSETSGDAGGLTPRDFVRFWKEAGFAAWFRKDDAFDQRLRERFLALHEEVAVGGIDLWLEDAEVALGAVLLLDQFPRNAFRATPRMFATDERAKAIADRALAAGFDQATEPDLRFFFYLPLEHSEDLADQERQVALHRSLGLDHITRYAVEHRDIIQRFGRFPHRNAVLGRESTPEEIVFLESGGFSG